MYAGQITVQVSYQGSFDQLAAKIRAAAAGGGLPNVATAREQDVAGYATANIAVPLAPYISSSKWGLTQSRLSDLTPGSLSRTKLQMYGGKRLTWPFGNTAAVMYYNTTLLHEAGITHTPNTWDQVMTDSEKIKKTTGKAGFLMQQNSLGPNFTDALWTYGVPWLAKNQTATNFSSPHAVTILKDWRQMIADGSMVLTRSTDQSEFVSGTGAMEMASSGYAVGTQFKSRISGFDWSVGALPTQPNQKPVTELYGSVNTMFKASSQQQLASWLFMKYFASSQNQSLYCSGGGGCVPATKSSSTSSAMKAAFDQDPQYKQAVAAAANAQLPPQIPAVSSIRTNIANADVLEVLLGQISPSDGAKKLAYDSNQAIQQGG